MLEGDIRPTVYSSQSVQAKCTICTALFEVLQLMLQKRAAKMMAKDSSIQNQTNMAAFCLGNRFLSQ